MISIEQLWESRNFKPNESQRRAILHLDGPLYLPAGPGSGKTRVLLWRVVNLIACQDINPKDIYLCTFTEKAALQLKEGLRVLLGEATNHSQKQYDISRMYVGTVHSSCHRILRDRQFTPDRRRPRIPDLMDELGQYLFLYRKDNWTSLTAEAGFRNNVNEKLNSLFEGDRVSRSRHNAVANCISYFNRLSEECIEPAKLLKQIKKRDSKKLVRMYDTYLELLKSKNVTDFSLVQQEALHVLERFPKSGSVFKYVIVDEYQDTNTVQEKLFFRLASGYKNICVVGDDDQALYRFRGATVENFVDFPNRCQKYLGQKPTEIPLVKNYRFA